MYGVVGLYLDRVEEAMYRGEYGRAVEIAMKVIVKVGEAIGAERLVKVDHVHVSGVSYRNISDPGLEFIESLASMGGSFQVYTTVNPTCIDLGGLVKVFDQGLVDGQLRIIKALKKLGVKPVYTCIPYSIRKPNMDEHLAWGESNAVAIANSVYGARTNREGGPLTIASALTGRTYYAGLHILSNRVVGVEVFLEQEMFDEAWASILGLYIGEYVTVIPYIHGASRWGFMEVKEFLASAAASGSHALVVLEGYTPPETYVMGSSVERLCIGMDVLESYYDRVSSTVEVDGYTLVYIGCPHLDSSDLRRLASRVEKYSGLKNNVLFLVTIPYAYYGLFREEIEILRSRGIDVAYGVCPIVSLFREKPDKVLTNSGKALFYLTRWHKLDVGLASIDRILEVVMVK